MWARDDLLEKYRNQLLWQSLVEARKEPLQALHRAHWNDVWRLHHSLPQLESVQLDIDLESAAIKINSFSELSQEGDAVIVNLIQQLVPWRKGPFDFFGHYIEAEWQSNMKWDRIAPFLSTMVKGRRIADVGCGNGYYMFRSVPLQPECIIGFDPSEKFYFAFEFAQHFVRAPQLQFELLGLDHLKHFPNFFDVVVCMGVLYHQRSPLEALKVIWEAIRPGGYAILESITIPGQEDICLFPKARYAKMRNVFFLPTQTAFISWLTRSGYAEVEILSESVTTPGEQRITPFTFAESLSDFLNPNDPSLTLEGYPSPRRTIVAARKLRDC